MGLDKWRARWLAHLHHALVQAAGSELTATLAPVNADSAQVHARPLSPGHHGAGWFTSTWDLLTGLDVREGLPDDVRPEEALMAYLLEQEAGG